MHLENKSTTVQFLSLLLFLSSSMFFARDRMRFLGQTRSRGRAGASSQGENKYLSVQRRPDDKGMEIPRGCARAPKRNFLALGLSFAIQLIRRPLRLSLDDPRYHRVCREETKTCIWQRTAAEKREIDADAVFFS